MIKLNIKASNSIMSDKQFKLSDLIPEFSKFRTIEDKKRIGCQTVDDSLFVLSKKGKKYFSYFSQALQLYYAVTFLNDFLPFFTITPSAKKSLL